ncbi:type I restriction enzyme, S subunit [Ferrimonas marina]|uniref:Type I restriction enzyme, S subunit n=1 Tax=Ferrimonas marina TaxID=299255 RepID=A0A1M5X805_9GAMM|nr:type I restriction enzyme, S subunit [Ferrimonas marina]
MQAGQGRYMPYPRYKESKVEGLSEVPEHWQEPTRVKFESSLKGRLGWQGLKASEYRDEGPHVVSSAHFRNCAVEWERCPRVSMERYNLDSNIQLREGDILLMKDGAAMGKMAFVDSLPGPSCLNSHLLLFRPLIIDGAEPSYVPKFLFYFLLTELFQGFIKVNGTGATFLGISQQAIGNYSFYLPPYDEQRTIAAFLDYETARIDDLIAKQQRLIELLKEKRQAVISHAVTKGLNPDTPLKDSGIEWLGQVPEHWEVMAIKRLSKVMRGASPRPIDDPKYFDDEGSYAWVRIADVSASGMYLNTTKQQLSPLGSSLSVKLEPGELFLSIAGTVGKPCITGVKACIHDGFVYFPELSIEPKFLYYLFAAGEAYKGLGKMGTQLNLNTDTVGNIKIGVPKSEKEIEGIASYLDVKFEEYERLISVAQSAIDLMQERRTALISAAVTGKIDLRDWERPETNHVA